MHDQTHLSSEMEQCITNCQECHRSCVATTSHCLQLGGQHSGYEHIRLLLDCAQICETSADFMLRSSPFHTHTCGVCAEVCDRCADDCLRIAAGKDSQMQTCADVCRRCAETCRKMSLTHVA